MEVVRACIDAGVNRHVDKLSGVKTRVHATSLFMEAKRKERHEEVTKLTLMFHTDCGAIKIVKRHLAGEEEYHPIIMQNWVNPLIERADGKSDLEKQNANIQTELAREIYPNAKIVVQWVDLVGVARMHHHLTVMKPSDTTYATNLFSKLNLSGRLPEGVKLGMQDTYISQLHRIEDSWTDTMIAVQALTIPKLFVTYSSREEQASAETYTRDIQFVHSNDEILRAKNLNLKVYPLQL